MVGISQSGLIHYIKKAKVPVKGRKMAFNGI